MSGWAYHIKPIKGTRRGDYHRHTRQSQRNGPIAHLWFVDPEAQTLEVFELRDGHWTLLETATGDAEIAPPPFSAAPFKLGDLWWTSTPKLSEPSSVHEPAATAAHSPAAG